MDTNEISKLYRTYRPKAISRSLNKFSRFHDAADLLIDAGLELHKRVEYHKVKHGKDMNYLFFKKIEKAIRHAFNFINDIQIIYDRNQHLEYENKLLRQELSQANEELNVYHTIEACLLSEKLPSKIETVKHKINNDHE